MAGTENYTISVQNAANKDSQYLYKDWNMSAPWETMEQPNYDRHSCVIGRNCSILVEFVGNESTFGSDRNYFQVRDKCNYNHSTLYPLNHLVSRATYP